MDKKTTISFALSQEEIFVLLSYLQVKGILGLDIGVLAELSEEQTKLILGVAERALIARGFLIASANNDFKVTDIAHAVLRTCTNPDTTVSINCRFPERPEETYYYHTARKMSVLHTLPMTAIHQFLAVENQTALLKSAFSILELKESPKLECISGQITEDALNQIREEAGQIGVENVADKLVKNGLNLNTANEFATSLSKPLLNHTIIHIKHKANGDSQVNGFALLKGENGLWMLKPVENGSSPKGLVSIKPVAIDDIGNTLKEMFVSS